MVRLTTRSSQLPAPDVVCAALTKTTTTSFSGPCHNLSYDHQNHQDSRIGRFETCADPPAQCIDPSIWSLADQRGAPPFDERRSEGNGACQSVAALLHSWIAHMLRALSATR